MYRFEINQAKKAVVVTVEGFFTEQEAISYLADYQSTVSKVTPATFSLILDGKKQAVVAQGLKENLQQAVDLYLSSGFKNVYVIPPESAIASSQFKRLNGADKITFTDSAEEALALV